MLSKLSSSSKEGIGGSLWGRTVYDPSGGVWGMFIERNVWCDAKSSWTSVGIYKNDDTYMRRRVDRQNIYNFLRSLKFYDIITFESYFTIMYLPPTYIYRVVHSHTYSLIIPCSVRQRIISISDWIINSQLTDNIAFGVTLTGTRVLLYQPG